MKTEGKLLAQDDIDVLLGEAGIEGDYDSKKGIEIQQNRPIINSIVKFSNVTDDEVHETFALLLSKALLERDDNVKVIWNAGGTIPMAAGFHMNIQNMEFESLGALKDNHLMVKQKSIE